MKKILAKALLVTSLVSAVLIGNFTFAQQSNQNLNPAQKTESKSKVHTATDQKITTNEEDPDLKLSIEELKKKYPITWLKKQYGDYNHPSCGNSDGAFEYEGAIPKNLICSFFIHNAYSENNSSTFKPSVSIDFFSTSQIKSALIEYYTLWKLRKVDQDERVREIVILAILTFEQNTNNLSKNQKDLLKFIYKSHLLPITQDPIECNYVNSIYRTKILCSSK